MTSRDEGYVVADGDRPVTRLDEALAMEVDGSSVRAHVHEGWDVQGIPHGGYVAAIAARAALLVDGAPDLLTTTTHFHRKAEPGPLELEVTAAGGSRRLRTLLVRARQGDTEPLLTALVCVGDRAATDGPSWSDLPGWDPAEERLTPAAGDPAAPFDAPQVAERFGLRLELSTAGFAEGTTGEHAAIRAVGSVDGAAGVLAQLAALVVCDVTPPAVWNVLGMQGWVPTVELTAHVRARPAPGPLAVEATTHQVGDGFLDEDAVVRDATGQVVVMSRQLAMWTGA